MASEGIKYAEYILNELKSLTAYQRCNLLNIDKDDSFKLNIGKIEIQSIFPWSDGKYPQTIDFAYKNKIPNWKKFRDVAEKNIVFKNCKICENVNNEAISSILFEDNESFVKFVYNQEETPHLFYGWIVDKNDDKKFMIKGIEMVIDLSKSVGVKATPFIKTPHYALKAF